MKTIPDNWVILSITQKDEIFYKVFASWAGGYLDGDYWRLNSGISGIYKEDEYYRVSGFSGSHYMCKEGSYGIVGASNKMQLSSMIESAKGIGITIEVLPEDTNFLNLKY